MSNQAFVELLRQLSAGATMAELDETIDTVTEGVLLARAGGEITLKLSVKPNSENSVEIEAKVSSKVPMPKRGKSIFYVSEGRLQRNDPRQTEMPLRSIPVPEKAQVREVAHA